MDYEVLNYTVEYAYATAGTVATFNREFGTEESAVKFAKQKVKENCDQVCIKQTRVLIDW